MAQLHLFFIPVIDIRVPFACPGTTKIWTEATDGAGEAAALVGADTGEATGVDEAMEVGATTGAEAGGVAMEAGAGGGVGVMAEEAAGGGAVAGASPT